MHLTKKGFSIIEVMLAIMIITLGVIPVYHLLSSGTRGVSVSVREIQAVNHAVCLIELLKGLGFDKLASLCELGQFKAEQVGWMQYDRTEHKFKPSQDGRGVWEVIEGSDEGKRFFRENLGPLGPSIDEASGSILSQLEVFFTGRLVVVDCSSNDCTITVKVTWESDQGLKDRETEFTTLVMESK